VARQQSRNVHRINPLDRWRDCSPGAQPNAPCGDGRLWRFGLEGHGNRTYQRLPCRGWQYSTRCSAQALQKPMPEQSDPSKRVARTARLAFATAKPRALAISSLLRFKCALPVRRSAFASGVEYLAQRIGIVRAAFTQRLMAWTAPWPRVEHGRGEHAGYAHGPASGAPSYRRMAQSHGAASVFAQVRYRAVDSGLTSRRKS
jgi:hypothetical protein